MQLPALIATIKYLIRLLLRLYSIPCSSYHILRPMADPRIFKRKTLSVECHIDVTLPPGVVLPLGLILMTDSSSRSMCVFASLLSLVDSRFNLSSFIFVMRSSLVRVLLCLGIATASKTSSASEELKSMLDRDRDSPFSALRASSAVPSSTAVSPPNEIVGESIPLIDDIRRSFRSILDASATFPSSHSCIRAFRSIPIDSYCINKFVPSSATSSVSLRVLSDSSRRTCSFACKPRIPEDREFSLRSCARQRSRPGVRGILGVAGTGKPK